MAKGAKFRSIRRIVRLDLNRSDYIEQPALMETGKFNLIKMENGTTGREFPLEQTQARMQIINQNKIGYRKVKKQFSSSESFLKAFDASPRKTESEYYKKLNKETDSE